MEQSNEDMFRILAQPEYIGIRNVDCDDKTDNSIIVQKTTNKIECINQILKQRKRDLLKNYCRDYHTTITYKIAVYTQKQAGVSYFIDIWEDCYGCNAFDMDDDNDKPKRISTQGRYFDD
jgi:hypothetical protein